MKKLFIFIALFIIPIVAYLFFATGVNEFIKLPIITEKVPELPIKESDNVLKVQLKDRITILGFGGIDFERNASNLTNLSHKIYDKNKDFVDFQMVYICPIGTEVQVEQWKNKISRDIDLKKWYFIFLNPQEIQKFYNSLQLMAPLDANYGSSSVYIIDKEHNLRGRKGKNKKGDVEYREGYNTASPADLHNEMADDVKVILAEYRLALKKNNRKGNVTN